MLLSATTVSPDALKPGVYSLRNTISGRVYVGSTKLRMLERWKQHLWCLENDRHSNNHLARAWKKYGEDAFEFSAIEVVSDVMALIDREQYWIDKKSEEPAGVYNMRPARYCGNWAHRLGEVRSYAKLTWSGVRRIRENKEPGKVLARDLGVSEQNISNVRHYRSWKYDPDGGEIVEIDNMANVKSVFTWDDILYIRESDEKQSVLADKYGVSSTTISNITRHKIWKHDPRGTEYPAMSLSRPYAKLTWEDVRFIRESDERNCVLAKKYDVYPSAISGVRRYKAWKNDPNGKQPDREKKEEHHSAKLTWPDVRAIRESDDNGAILAKRYGVDVSTICYIIRGETWKDDPSGAQLKERAPESRNAKLTWEDVRFIRNSDEDRHVLAARLGVCYTTIGDIKRYRSWKNDPLDQEAVVA